MEYKQVSKLKLPDSPGVYIFKDAKKRPLYIGRATSLKDRVKSYFNVDLITTRGPRIVDMVTKSKSLAYQSTDSVLEAILLESQLIKRYQPHYNVDERDDKSSQYVIITGEDWPRVFLARARDFDQAVKDGRLPYAVKKRFGPYPEGGLIKEALKILRKLFPFKDKRSFNLRHDSFYQTLGRSPDGNDEAARREYEKTIQRLIFFFEGKKRRLRSGLVKQMNALAKQLRFEEAGRLKRLIYALDHINDIALIKRADDFNRGVIPAKAGIQGYAVNIRTQTLDSRLHGNDKRGQPHSLDVGIVANHRQFRIEAYDIAHLSGTNVVGAMAVSINGEAVPAEYRKFKISKNKNDDAAALAEMLSRRLNHSEWEFPDLIVVDGNQIQMHAAEDVLKVRRIAIPIIAVTKDEHHKADRLIGNAELINCCKREIVAANAEAHRFAVKYHRLRRRKSAIVQQR